MESKISSGHEDNDLVTSLYLTPDNEILLCGSEKGHVNLIGLNNTESYIGKLKRQLQLNSSVTSIFLLESEFVCDDKTYSVLMFAGIDNGLISWWKTNDRSSIYGCGRTPFSSTDPKQLLESENSAKLLEIDGEQEIGRVASCVSQLVGYFQDTNPMLLSTCKSDEDISITILNVIKGQQVKKLSGHKGPVTALCLVEPTMLLSASLDGTVRCWNVQTGTCSRVDESNFGSKCGIKCLTVFPNKESYLIGSRNNVMEEHKLETGKKVGRDIQLGPRFNMKHLAVSHDSRTVTCCYDNYFSEMREKDNGEYKVILSMMGHQNEWGNISKFGEDGHTVLSGTTHCRLKAWDTNNGHTLAYVGRRAVQSKQQLEKERKIESHTRMVTSVKMHKERFILTGSYDKSIKVWKIEKNEDSVGLTYHVQSTFFFEHAVTSVDVTTDDVVCVGLLNGLICFLELRDTCFKQ